MKWFKHMSDLPRDEGVSRYLDAAGKDRVTAYGFLMLLLEAIASRMQVQEGDLICSATYSIPHWGRITYSHPNRVRKYLGTCEVIGWVLVEFEGGMCKVSIPRMLEWRDEYTRKSGLTPDKVAQSRADQKRSDQRESRSEDSPPDRLTAEIPRRTPPPNFEVTEDLQEWAAKNHPAVDIEKETAKFRNYEFSREYSNWDARWKTWIQRAAERQGKLNGTSHPPNDNDELLKIAVLLGIEKRTYECETDYCSRIKRINDQRISNLGT